MAASEQQSTKDRLEEAAFWRARLKSPDAGESDRSAFRAWIAADPLNRNAMAEVERIDGLMKMLAAADPGLAIADPVVNPAPVVASRSPGAGRRAALYSAAASLAFVALGVWRFGGTDDAGETVIHANDGRVVQHLTLPDGSAVDLDAGSRLTVHYTAAERRLELTDGRAAFDVRKDPSRPFAVSAAGSRTVALGTHFQVEHVLREVVVTLEEGSVAVSGGGAQGGWSERLVPGEELRLSVETGQHERNAVDVERATSWTTGRLSFHDTPLSEVVGEVNRYAEPKLRIGDASLGSLKVGGNFVAGNSAGVAAALGSLLPLRVEADGDGELVLHSRATPTGVR